MSIFNKIFKGNTLYYPGCLTKYVLKEIMENYKKALEKEGIDFIMLHDKELCCGSPLKNAGSQEKFREAVRKNFEVFKAHGVGRIITNCPACALMMQKDYREVLGSVWDIEVKHFTEIISPDKLPGQQGEGNVTYHDPCHLGRGLGIYDQPRKIIEKKGYKIIEMSLCRDKSICCGGGGGVRSNNPELSTKIAKDRIAQAEHTGAKTLISPCPMCYANLKENGKDKEFDVKELSQIL